MISSCRPSVSWSCRYSRTLPMSTASWARVSSSQKTVGDPVARARVTASFTQSRTGTSLVWHIRQMSPPEEEVPAPAAPRRVGDPHRAGGRDLEGLVVRAVLLGGLRHQPD